MNATKLSICIATYNIENYISECLDSIYKYVDFPEFEIIVVDDCSTDNTRDVVKKWMLNHPDVAVVFKKNNKNS
jgi:glycosyltransferase involved in cell wall biosynthesis